MHICLLVTTRDRALELERLFLSLAQQTYKKFSVTLVDQSTSDVLDSLIEKYTKLFSIERIKTAPCSLSAARNIGLKHVSGDIVSLADDDCYFANDAFEKLLAYIKENSIQNSIWIGSGYPAKVPSHYSKAPIAKLNKFSVFKSCPSWCIFLDINICKTVGDFDVDLGIGAKTPWLSGEETDYLLRAIEKQFTVYRCPSVHIFHDAENLDNLNISKVQGYGLGRMHIIKKHNMPLWFTFLNIIFPLTCLITEISRLNKEYIHYRWHMFLGRLQYFFSAK